MKSFIVFALFVAAAVALPVDEKDAIIEQYDNNNIGVNGYNYKLRTSNGINLAEDAVVKNEGSENEALEVRGQFSYPGADGVIYTVTYVANENGFQASGAHLPQPPQ
ncbi:flexible cuticle protein 12-like [Zerene cesonia]|uniref:flexible cuticle protein 12-like n=1 Tax=Zerene cesonia TaxID=33412 RepID=UPI0018E517D7|nr:flexible cuticle protein 12-like [Zerene cesonia]